MIHAFPGIVVEEDHTIDDHAKPMVVSQPLAVTPKVIPVVNVAPLTTQATKRKAREYVMRYQKYAYADSHEGQFTTKAQLITNYSELKNQLGVDIQNQYPELRKLSSIQTSLITVRDLENVSLNLALIDEDKVAKVQLKMDRILVPEKIMFHKGVSEVLYFDLTKETLAHKNSQQKVSRLESQLK